MEAHKIKFARKGEQVLREYSPEEFQQAVGVNYLPELVFENEKTHRRIRAQCEKAIDRGFITGDMKWLGALYKEHIARHLVADVSVRWIDETFGYGLFAEQDLNAGDYIGEYTGIVRKRMIFSINHNVYCFSYPTAEIGFRRHMIDALKDGNELRYANDSDDPNSEPRCILVDGVLHMILQTNQRIPAGSQITFDYNHNYWRTQAIDAS